MTAVMALRAAVHNLCTIPVKDLLSTAEYIATTISESSAILSVPANQGQSAGEPDKAVLLQKLKARITSLLQDKTVEGRWAGVVIVKATVESGGWEILRGCEPWARSILAILGKPDPFSLKKLGILCLTRIFQLTHPYPTLTREITTPMLPQLGSIAPPSISGEHGASINPEISRDEREALLSVIPPMHAASLDVLRSLLETFGAENPSIARSCLEQTIWMFTSSNSTRSVREAAYKCFITSLTILGPALTKPDVLSLVPVLQIACIDIVPPKDSPIVTENTNAGGRSKATSVGTTNADAFLQNKAKVALGCCATNMTGPLAESAVKLLLTTLAYVQTEHIPLSLRAKIDRTSILTGNSDLMLACVLNPIPSTESQRGHPSILPFLARSQPSNPKVEGLLRPRMPVIFTGAGRKGRVDIEDYENSTEVETHGGDSLSRQNPDVRESLAEKFGPRPVFFPTESTSLPSDVERGNKRRHQDDVDSALLPGSPQPDKWPRVQNDMPTSSNTLPSGQVVQALDVLSSSLSGSNDQNTSKMNVFPEPEINHPTQDKAQEPSQPREATKSHEKVPAADAESDDEIPQLNIESDTDEEGEE
ncbi:hypothetical protein GTR04_2974 [Trichophyton interdigitale]|uniref:Pre-rRNA-processing protein RIX1 n=1 Tax=Trichophyton interdigitale TaxID=101480 RepID=A0A9P5CXT0_9EURO|nr:hypothetical protein GY631_2898 [Trichophyton interdigitale]KAF3896988.1 hypothetical protein GY632_2492 [Trichophyton interdigitale]KAG8209655.1 hypothetical protein GTR04_2974 [Trichophyton interdigitale]